MAWFHHQCWHNRPDHHYRGLLPNCVLLPAECLSNSVPSVGQSCSRILNFVRHVERNCPVLTMSLFLWEHLWVSLHLKRMEHLFLKQAWLWVQNMNSQKKKVGIFTLFQTLVGFCITQLVINQETCHFISGQDHFIFITGQTSTTSSQVVTRSPLRQARNSPRLAKVTAPGLPSSVKEEQIKGECRSASSACFWFSALLYGGYQKWKHLVSLPWTRTLITVNR